MLQPVDDFPFHQAATTFDRPYVDDSRWFDRYWFMCGSLDERICVITGVGTYPNTGRIDAYAMIGDGEQQWNLRAGRERDPNPLSLDASGLRFELVEAMERWQITCSAWDHAEFELGWKSIYPPNELPLLFIEKDGKVLMEHGHFAQGGAFSGSLRIGERQVAVQDWAAERDHSWGRRDPGGAARSGMHVWLPAQVGDRQIWIWWREGSDGRRHGLEGIIRHRDGRSWNVEDVQHELEVVERVPPHREIVSARLEVILEGGETMEIAVEPVVPMFISAGGYTNDENAHGNYDGIGATHFAHGDEAHAAVPAGTVDHFSRITVDGEVGQGIFELSIGRYDPLGLPYR
jgi:hypothetical protein